MDVRFLFVGVLLLLALLPPSVAAKTTAPQIEPNAATWQPWVLPTASVVRPPAPPDLAATSAELAQLKTIAASRADPDVATRISYWDAGAPTYRWVDLGVRRILQEPIKGVNSARHIALLTVAMYDATLATWDAKYTFNRERPSLVDASLSTSVTVPASPSYPSEHAATAAAAAAILSYLYPDDAGTFANLAEHAGQSRIAAGVQYPSDVSAGAELGRAVAARVIERARADGFDQVSADPIPVGPGLWNGTDPQYPLGGTWKTWVLRSGDQFRPGPPPSWESADMQAELDEIKSFPRTFDSNSKAFAAQTPDGIFGSWYALASQRMFERHLDTNPPRAARIYALMGVAHHDAFVACWDAKYAYWRIRPFQADAEVTTLFPTPNHPSYPAAHGCNSSSMATLLSYLFPEESDSVWAKANDNGWSRLWAGIHYRSDIEAGLSLGRSVGDMVVEHARHDGS